MNNILNELKNRGLIYQSTNEEELKQSLTKPVTVYCGFDPTADSLHVGNLVAILTLRRLQLAGHKVIALIGGGTGLIGDPGGRNSERKLNPTETVTEWSEKIKKQLERFLDFTTNENPAILLNNYNWLENLDVISFLRDIGKNFSINNMLAKDSVSSRLENGISFTEFSYMVLQGYDYLHLSQSYDCSLQIGGSDQWGNIVAGVDLIRKVTDKNVKAFTFPLVTKRDGTKFGKSAEGAIWLEEQKLSPYKFYQFWLNADDADVINYLKIFTFLNLDEIASLESEVQNQAHKRKAQKVLAYEMTHLVHGKEATLRAISISEALFSNNISDLSEEEILDCFSDIPNTNISDQNISLVDLLCLANAAKSKREAREFITNGAIEVNSIKIKNLDTTITEIDKLYDKILLIKRGKKNYYMCKVEA